MKVNGIIAEYNPFHHGHFYQLQQSKQATDADYTVVVLSGNFTQRGEVAICEKHLRARMALRGGADLVLELPAVYATSSAGEFAFGGISLLNSLGVIDTLSFGSECGDLQRLTKIAHILDQEPAEYQSLLTAKLSSGLPYPAARAGALTEYLKEDGKSVTELLQSPNNILAVEYLLALRKSDSFIQPYTLQRIGSDYHSEALEEQYSSASAIRKALLTTSDFRSLSSQMPAFAFTLMDSSTAQEYSRIKELLSAALFQKLYWEKDKGYTEYLDVSEGLSDRIRNQLSSYQDLEQFALSLKTKEMTLARIRRSLLHIVLNLKARDADTLFAPKEVPYARVLGFRKAAQPLLSAIKQNASIPLITKPADAYKLLDAKSMEWFRQDIDISQFYLCLSHQAMKGPSRNEYSIPIVIE